MITGVHTLIYSDDPAATRAYLRDVLRWGFVGDAGGGSADWLIFATGPAELGVHPVDTGDPDGGARRHEISLMCDDLAATMAELRERGAEFAGEPSDQGFGVVVGLRVPGADDLLLYQPRHTVAYGH